MRKEVVAHKDPKSPISEIFRTLRTNIQFMNTSKKLSTLLVTSTFPGEGKSWVSSNLAVTFAQTGKKVILIDADMRKGRQYVIFGASPRPGLSNYLSQVEMVEEENVKKDITHYIQETEVQNLYIMSAGNVPPNPSELLVSSRMIELLEELKNVCDIVIIDGTPCELVTDSVILSRIVDSTIVVAAYKITKKEALERVIKNIQNVGGKLAGVVLNKIPVSGKKYEEKYYYYGENADFSNKKAKGKRKRDYNYNKNAGMSKKDQVEEINKQRVAIMMEMDQKQENTSDDEELPKFIKRNIKSDNAEEISLEKTNNILKQMNQYLDQEKKNLNNQ